MRILMLTWEYPPRIIGGISRVVYHLARELNNIGSEVAVITCGEGNMSSVETQGNITVYRVEPYLVKPVNFINSVMQMNISMLEKAVQIINGGCMFDIVHMHDWLVAFAGKSLSGIYRIGRVCTIHSTEYGRNAGLHNEIQSYIGSVEEKMVLSTNNIIVNSLYMKNEIHALFGCPMENVHVIPNGIEPDMFSGNPPDIQFRRRYAADDEKIVFFIGRLVNEKGVHVLMDAVPRILSEVKNVRFVIAGSGPELGALQKRAEEMGVCDRVALPGFITDDDLRKMYKCADVAVFPSLYEPFGIVALEGMVVGIPVVVSEAGGLNEIVIHRVNGMKFMTGRSDLLAECIVELFRNPELVKDITENAWNTIIKKYQWRDIARKTYEVYEKCCGMQV